VVRGAYARERTKNRTNSSMCCLGYVAASPPVYQGANERASAEEESDGG